MSAPVYLYRLTWPAGAVSWEYAASEDAALAQGLEVNGAAFTPPAVTRLAGPWEVSP